MPFNSVGVAKFRRRNFPTALLATSVWNATDTTSSRSKQSQAERRRAIIVTAY